MAGQKHDNYVKIFNDPKRKAQMIAYRIAGYTYTQLALYYGVDHSTLVYHAKKAGLVSYTKKKRKEIVEMINSGKPIKEVAKKYSIPVTTVSSYCVMSGLKGHKLMAGSKKLVLRIPGVPIRTRKNKPYLQKAPTELSLLSTWKDDGFGGKVNEGKPIEQVRREEEERHLKNRTKGKINLLMY